MDFTESIEVVLDKVKELDPENAAKIVGYLLLEEHGEQEMIRLAHGTRDMLLYSINRAKTALNLHPQTLVAPTTNSSPPEGKKQLVSKLPTEFTPFVPSSSRFPPVPEVPNIPVDTYNVPMYDPSMYNYEYVQFPYSGPAFPYQSQFMPMESSFQYQPLPEGQFFEYYPHFQGTPELSLHQRPNQKPHAVSAEMRFCERFSRGYCKYGGECKFLHAVHVTDDYILVLSTPNSNEEVKQYHALSHGSVKELEVEVVGILKSKGPIPVPTTMLPALYQEKYGRKLQADGYFTAKFMQGKVICGLAELLSHMTATIRVFDRDGEACVILAEDVPKYMKSLEEANKEEQAFDSSCQIYLTFPPHSSFTHRDINDYFEYNFGPIKSVRIPTQEQRMYGFVTFLCQESVTNVLTKGNPHFICGMRVLAKPYRDKQTSAERKLEETAQRSTRNIADVESKNQSNSAYKSSCPKDQLNEEQEKQVDLKGKKILEMGVTKLSSHIPKGLCINCSAKGKSVAMVAPDMKLDERLKELNLPDSPFAYEQLERAKSDSPFSYDVSSTE